MQSNHQLQFRKPEKIFRSATTFFWQYPRGNDINWRFMFATSKQPAQHWAENSLLENEKEINEIIKKQLQRGLESLE